MQAHEAVLGGGMEPGHIHAAGGGVRGRPVAAAADMGPAQQDHARAGAARPRKGALLCRIQYFTMATLVSYGF